MKTKIISTLKKELLIIELPEGTDMKDPIQILKNKGNHLVYSKHNGHIISRNKLPDGEWTLLGSPDEIKEDDARELVESPIDKWGDDKFRFLDYRYDGCYDLFTATESLLSALESEIYWENPLGDRMPIFVEASPSAFKFVEKEKERWKEAQEKTFDKNRTLIFVKN